MKFYAHSKTDNIENWQLLLTHLNEVASLCCRFCQKFCAGEFGHIIGLFHDLGKYRPNFQKRLHGSMIRVAHANAGGIELKNRYGSGSIDNLLSTILAYCILGHHTGLPDYGSPIDSDNEGTLLARLRDDITDCQTYRNEIHEENIYLPKKLPFFLNPHHSAFSLQFFIRMLYSSLVDADFIETESFMADGTVPRGEFPTLSELKGNFDAYIELFRNPNSSINRKRLQTLDECIAKAKEPKGLFRLTVPTGGGKTLSSMAFAINHAIERGLDRIIYVIPYTSIIDQNAKIFKEIFGDGNVLEHHSNFEWKKGGNNDELESFPVENSALQKLKLSVENWDIPVIVTTSVQFFESLFAYKSSKVRKNHNIANSVIIFDEAQMLPLPYLKCCTATIEELVDHYESSVVLCTATQPKLELIFRPQLAIREIVSSTKELYDFYKRVDIKFIGEKTNDDLIERFNLYSQFLCIVHTRAHAQTLFAMLNDPDAFHLSTLLCPVHRKKIIEDIRKALKNGAPCKLISTSLIEAGVDFDFPVGFKAISGLDSDIQAAGRINREGKLQSGVLYLFEAVDCGRTPLSIVQGAQIAKQIMRDFEDPIDLNAIDAYYNELYFLHQAANYDSGGTMEEIANSNWCNAQFSFRKIDEGFKLIDDVMISVIIPYDDCAFSLIERLKYALNPIPILRELQQFTVNIYPYEFARLEGNGLIVTEHNRYNILCDMNYYHEKTGLQIPDSATGKGIFL